LADRSLHASVTQPLYWHIDRFDSLEEAERVAREDSVAAEAHGSAWLMTVERKDREHVDDHHVAWIGPLPLPPGQTYSMRVQSSLLGPGSATPVHTHPGPEVIYVVAGEQCLATPTAGEHIGAGDFLIVPAGTMMQGSSAGTGRRRALAIVLYDAAHPASHDVDDPPKLVACSHRAR
jgi:quercetin dioxygenase-like cupin family protein